MLTDDINNSPHNSDVVPPQGNPMGMDRSSSKMMGSSFTGHHDDAKMASKPDVVPATSGGAMGASSTSVPGGKPSGGLAKKFTPKVILGLLILILLMVGSGAALFLSRQTQDTRQQARSELPEAGQPACEFYDAGQNKAGEFCVGNNPTGDCYQGGQGNNYACYDLNGNPGKVILKGGLGYTGDACSCPSDFPWKNEEYGETWCFKTAEICDGQYIEFLGKDTGYQCSIGEEECPAPPGGGDDDPTPTPPGGGGPPPSTLSCNSICTSVAQCQAVNAGYTCTTTSSDGIGWNSGSPWSGPINLNSLPGTGEIQAQADMVISNGATLFQEYWRNNVGYTRTAPIQNNKVLFNQGTAWTTTPTTLPGTTGSVNSSTLIMQPNGTIVQGMWRNNQGWSRTMPTDASGNPVWGSATAWSGPIAITAIEVCAGSTMQSQADYIVNNVLGQAIWCGNQGWTRTVPISAAGAVLWGQASAWSGPVLPSPSLPGSSNIQSQTIFNMGDDYLIQGYWGTNQGWSREVPIGRRCRLASNPGSNTCSPGTTPSPFPTPSPISSPSPVPTPAPSASIVPNPSPSPTPIGPMCLNITMSKTQPKLGDSVNFTCALVPGVKWYDFRVIEPNGKITPLSATGQVSATYTIAQSGKFYAQCRICTTNPGTTCDTEFEPIGPQPSPIPLPSPTSPAQISPPPNPGGILPGTSPGIDPAPGGINN